MSQQVKPQEDPPLSLTASSLLCLCLLNTCILCYSTCLHDTTSTITEQTSTIQVMKLDTNLFPSHITVVV